MNKKMLALFAVVALTVTSCKKETPSETSSSQVETTQAAPVEGTSYAVQAADSKIQWEAGKLSGDKHDGTVNVKEGELVLNEGKIVGGKVVIDMNSIAVTDITDPEKKAMLEGHLKGEGEDAERQDHFFNVSKYPTATLDISGVTEENGKTILEGQLTIKGKSNPVKFPVTLTQTDEAVTLASDAIVIDRTLWNVNYSSGSVVKDLAADKVINDEVKFTVSLVAKK